MSSRLPVIEALAREELLIVAGAMAILEPLAFDGAPDVEVQALLAGQQSPVACCKRKSQCTFDLLPSHFPVA